MKMVLLLLSFLLPLISIETVLADWTYSASIDLLQKFKFQTPYARPINNQSDVLKITVNWVPLFLYDFDEVMGVLTMVSELESTWKDEIIKWEESDDKVPFIEMDMKHIWTPAFAVHNPAIGFAFGESQEKSLIRKFSFGQSFMKTVGITRTTCIPNMRHFPLDEHNCSVVFFTSHYTSNEVKFSQNSSLDISEYKGNNKWNVKSFDIHIPSYCGRHHCVEYFVNFKRKSTFILLNIMAPIILLNAINILVFCLPVQSGERISFCVTMFLALAVFMTIVSEEFPDGNPVPVLIYFLLTKLIYSSLIIVFTILSLKIYHGEKRSVFVRFLVKLISLCKTRQSTLVSGPNKVEKRSRPHIRCLQCQNKMDIDLQDVEMKLEDIRFQCTEQTKPPSKPFESFEVKGKEIKPQCDQNTDEGDSRNLFFATPTKDEDFYAINWYSIGNKFDYFCLLIFFLLVCLEIIIWIIFTWGYL